MTETWRLHRISG